MISVQMHTICVHLPPAKERAVNGKDRRGGGGWLDALRDLDLRDVSLLHDAQRQRGRA